MQKKATPVLWLAVMIGIIALVVVGRWQVSGDNPMLVAIEETPAYIMGTECLLRAVVPADQTAAATKAIKAAETALRAVELKMSAHLDSDSVEISKFNNAPAGKFVPLSAQTIEILALAKKISGQTFGAFDVTSAPLFRLWKKSGHEKRLPTEDQLAMTMELCGWEQFEIKNKGAVKHRGGAMLDLGGIAKGYGIDRAVEAMKKSGARGGLVNVGGDIRCFGSQLDGKPWRISIKDPFHAGKDQHIGVLRLKAGAVCTSGNYHRYVKINSVRYSHIIDPRTGWPADAAPAVTVVAPTAAVADAWATALSVLGEAGLDLIDKKSGIEAMLVIGTPEDHHFATTNGFNALLEKPIDQHRTTSVASLQP